MHGSLLSRIATETSATPVQRGQAVPKMNLILLLITQSRQNDITKVVLRMKNANYTTFKAPREHNNVVSDDE